MRSATTSHSLASDPLGYDDDDFVDGLQEASNQCHVHASVDEVEDEDQQNIASNRQSGLAQKNTRVNGSVLLSASQSQSTCTPLGDS